MTDDFERARRIVKTDEFSSVFRLRPVVRTAHFALYAQPNQLSHARLGVVASVQPAHIAGAAVDGARWAERLDGARRASR